MPRRYSQLHAMGVRPGLMHMKRNLSHFMNSSHVGRTFPLKQLQITEGSGAQRRLSSSELKDMTGEGMHKKAPRKVNPISFKF
jgi:hypothetical protein